MRTIETMAKSVDRAATKPLTKTVVVRNLPEDAAKFSVQDFMSILGPIKKCFFVRNEDASFKGSAYITYAFPEDATIAVQKHNGALFHGQKISVQFAIQNFKGKTPKNRKLLRKVPKNASPVKKEEQDSDEFLQKKECKNHQVHISSRNGTIIIRNLSFKATEENLREYFGSYGSVSDVSILKRANGLLVGCAFLQFSSKEEALTAIANSNMKKFMGRTIAVDMAVPRKLFTASLKGNESTVSEVFAVKEEPAEVKVEKEASPVQDLIEKKPSSASNATKGEKKSAPWHRKACSIKKEEVLKESCFKIEDSSEEEENDEHKSNDESDDSEESDDCSDKNSLVSSTNEKNPNRLAAPSKDVVEGRTIFIRDLHFDSTEAETQGILSKFGELKYVLFCIDKMTELPKGTAFAQFMTKESADACLAAYEDPVQKPSFTLHGRRLSLCRAMSRKELENKKTVRAADRQTKDKRNLYLLREGVIREGTAAAVGISKGDMALRKKREELKHKAIKNLHMFVSPVRLCVGNLPVRITDHSLRQIFQKHSSPGAKIKEARVIKNLKQLDADGNAVSKGFGFVCFTEHSHALQALQKINNNPEIFSAAKRPIVEFSLENQNIHNIKHRRMMRSKDKNPTWIAKNRPAAAVKSKRNEQAAFVSSGTPQYSFMGYRSKPGETSLHRHIGAKIRHREVKVGKGLLKQFKKRKLKRDKKIRAFPGEQPPPSKKAKLNRQKKIE